MPNYCSDLLIVTGDKKRLGEFDTQFKKKSIAFEGTSGSRKTLKEAEEEKEKAIEKGYKAAVRKRINKYSGEEEYEINIIENSSESENYSFTNFVPLTEEIYLNEGWYDWSCKNWGTKWDAIDPHCDKYDDKYSYLFTTAWSSCQPIVREMAKQYPDLNFRLEYEEDGCEYAGILEISNGEESRVCYGEDGPDNYEQFKKEFFGTEYYTCSDCGKLIEEWELDSDKCCPKCESTKIYDTDGETLLL